MKITVLISVYNGEKYLREAIESILGQTFSDFEFLIINDASTDSSREIILSCKDSRIKLIDNEINLGLTKSLNKGLKLAQGEYVARMDADDVSLPSRLEKQVEFLENNPEIGVLGCRCHIIDGSDRIVGMTWNPRGHRQIMSRILSENQMIHSSIIYRRRLLEELGGYDDNLKLAQDYELLLRLSEKTKLANYGERLHKWRMAASGGITHSRRNEQVAARDNYRTGHIERHLQKGGRRFIKILADNFALNPSDPILKKYYAQVVPMLGFFKRIAVVLLSELNLCKAKIKRIMKPGIFRLMGLIRGGK